MRLLTSLFLFAAVTHALANPQVVLTTSEGEITVDLFADEAPVSVENFLDYVRSGHYDGTIFHRVIDGFMIQGGGFTPDMRQKPTRDPIENEADNGLSNERGTLAMARLNDPHTATAQFFINLVDNTRLDHRSPATGASWGYAVFGRVVEGMDVVDAIGAAETAPRDGQQNVPIELVIIEQARIIDSGSSAGE